MLISKESTVKRKMLFLSIKFLILSIKFLNPIKNATNIKKCTELLSKY